MTEHGRKGLDRSADALRIGTTAAVWESDALVIDFDDVAAPFPRRMSGRVRLSPQHLCGTEFQLDLGGRHHWRPIAARAAVEVALREPDCAWSGEGYFDMNIGEEPLEAGFSFWNWSRAHLSQDSLVFYDASRRDGGEAALALRIAPDGAIEAFEPPKVQALPPTLWRMPRTTRAQTEGPARVTKTLEDTPFYARSMLQARYFGQPASVLHESLSLDRLRSPLIRALLPFRMPRRLL